MLYLNNSSGADKANFLDLTLTSVVFEFSIYIFSYVNNHNLTLTSVVFEFTTFEYFPTNRFNLTLTSVVFE